MDVRRRRQIYDRTGGRCHLCDKKLAFKNYGSPGARAAWNVDHSRARARGGSDRLSNLLPACISCNSSKQARPNRAIRRRNGVAAKPPSRVDRRLTKARKQFGAFGAVVGLAAGGLPGAFVGGVLGAALPSKKS